MSKANSKNRRLDLQTEAMPLDKPIRFGRKTIRNGRVVKLGQSRQFESAQEYVYTAEGRRVPRNETKLVKWAGKYHRISRHICSDLPE